MEKALDHIALNVKDVELMLAFYTEIVGLAPERVEEFHRGQAPFPSVRIHQNTLIDFIPHHGQQNEKANLNHFCLSFAREEWDKLCERIKKGQIPIEEGPINRWGAHGEGTSIYFRDPEGNLLEARYYP